MKDDLHVLVGLLLLALLSWGAASFLPPRVRLLPSTQKNLRVSADSRTLEWAPDASPDSAGRAANDVPAKPLPAGWIGLLLGVPLDLCKASLEDLDVLPGIGPKTAEEIMRSRSRGGWRTVDDVCAARGVGPKTLERLRPWVVVPGCP